MGAIKTGIGLAVFAVAGAAYFTSAPEMTVDGSKSAVGSMGERYELLQAGRDTGCVIRKGEQLSDSKVELVLGQGCADGFGDYAEARYWTDEPDGSIALVAADGSVALRFAASDGHAYEAYGDGVPLFALSDASYSAAAE